MLCGKSKVQYKIILYHTTVQYSSVQAISHNTGYSTVVCDITHRPELATCVGQNIFFSFLSYSSVVKKAMIRKMLYLKINDTVQYEMMSRL